MKSDVARYIVVGLSTNLLNFGLFTGLRAFTDLSVFFSSIVAYGLAITYSFIATNSFVFSQADRKITPKKLGSYVAVIALSAVLQAQVTAMVAADLGVESLGWVSGAVFAAAFNYVMLKRFVFFEVGAETK